MESNASTPFCKRLVKFYQTSHPQLQLCYCIATSKRCMVIPIKWFVSHRPLSRESRLVGRAKKKQKQKEWEWKTKSLVSCRVGLTESEKPLRLGRSDTCYKAV